MTDLTDFDILILQLVEEGNGQWRWYQMGHLILQWVLRYRPDMYEVLTQLAANRLITPGSWPLEKWTIIDKVRQILDQLDKP